ncbi:MAG: MASE3 domain-containing protein, partial [Phycisphaerae bacterium]
MAYSFRYSKQIKQGLVIVCAAAILIGLYLTSLHSYLLFHTVSELFTIAIAFAMFIIVWNSRQFIEDNYLSFIGIAFLFIGSLDLVHTLAYKGMGVFQGYNPDIATQLWVASRYLHSISFIAAVFFVGRKLRHGVVACIYFVITAIVLLSIFYWENFPTCFVEETGLTKFKKISEMVVCGFFVVAILLLYLNRKQFKKSVLILLSAGLFLSICSELAFTLYGSVYGSANVVGHYFKIISFYLIYRALIKTQLIDPYNTIFRNLKRHEKILVQEQKERESILSTIPDAIYIVNRNYDIEYANPAMRNLFGEIDGKKCYEYLVCSDKPCSFCKFSEVLEGKTTRWEYTSTNGKVYDAIDAPFVNIFTGHVSKLKILRDMTDIKLAEQVLRRTKDELEKKVSERTAELVKTNEMLIAEIAERKKTQEALHLASLYTRSLIESSLDPLVTISADGKITDVNEATIKVTGVSREKLIGTDFSIYFTEPQKAREGYQQVFAKGLVTDYPLTIKNKDGKLTDVLYNAAVYKDADGNVIGVFAAARDVTAQKQASQYARSLIESSLDPLVTISADGKITDVNEATIKVTGIDRQQLIGTDFSNYFTEPQKAREGYQRVFANGLVTDYPLTIKHKNGRLTDVLYNASVYTDIGGNILGVFAAARDITKRNAIERKQGITNSLLELFAAKTSRKEYLDATTKVIRDWSGCEFIGIRIKDNDGN